MWPEGDEPQRYEWEVGTLIVPPNMWFHQHFNTGTDAGALSRLQARGASPIRNAQGVPKAWISRRIGGDQIDYADEKPDDPQACSPRSSPSTASTPRMDQAYAQELPDLRRRSPSRRSVAPDQRPNDATAAVPAPRSAENVRARGGRGRPTAPGAACRAGDRSPASCRA